MRLLASTGPMFARPLDWAFGVIAEAGYDGAELMVTQDPATQDAERVARVSRSEGIPVPVVHGPFLLLTRRVFGTDLVAKARRSLELAGDLGAEVMIVHPPFRWQREFHTWLLEAGDDEAAELGTRVGVENLYPVSVAGRPVRFHRYTLPEHLTPFTDVVLDTSHFGVAEADINLAYELLRDRAVHLHVSDNRGGGRDSHAPLGHGILPLAGFLGRVAEDVRLGRGRAGDRRPGDHARTRLPPLPRRSRGPGRLPAPGAREVPGAARRRPRRGGARSARCRRGRPGRVRGRRRPADGPATDGVTSGPDAPT